MKRLDLADYIVNEHYTTWPIDFAISASFEVPVARVLPALPPLLQPMEVRPGVALLNLSIFNFTAQTYGLSAPCTEVVLNVHVIPNLSRALTLPRLSMFTLRLGASTREFIDSPFATDRYPCCPDPLDVRLDRERVSAEVTDSRGRPVLRLAVPSDVPRRYEHDRFYVQSSTFADGRLLMSGTLFEFSRGEHQRRDDSIGGPVAHPFFDGLDVSGITPRACYLQMWLQPGTIGHEHHFLLQPVATAGNPTPGTT